MRSCTSLASSARRHWMIPDNTLATAVMNSISIGSLSRHDTNPTFAEY
jgi:hypothetical protein